MLAKKKHISGKAHVTHLTSTLKEYVCAVIAPVVITLARLPVAS